ncbi:MAG: hypothetical protein R6V67_07345 [Spirochaetia bacterium]
MRFSIILVVFISMTSFILFGCASMEEQKKDKEQEEEIIMSRTTPFEDFDGDGIPDRVDDDTDNDGFSDWLEEKHGTDPRNPFDHPEIKSDADR